MAFFPGDMVPASHSWQPALVNQRQRITYYLGKTIIISLLILESCWLYVSTGNFNDDQQRRPPLHGAYHVDTYIIDNDTIPPLETHQSRWKKVFFHRYDYFIVQNMNDEIFDFEMKLDTAAHTIDILEQETRKMQLSYEQPNPAILIFEGETGGRSLKCIVNRINWQDMPLLKKEFNWTID